MAGWAKDTSHLSLKEEAIYLRLINFYYDHEKPIPLKTHLVLRKLRMADESETVDLILDEFFIKTKDGWIQNHCEKLIGEYQKMAERNKKNAKLGGRPKINNLDKPSGKQDETEVNPTGIPNYKLETKNQELETNNKKPEVKPKRFAPPSLKDVLDYMTERGYPYQKEAESFIDYYSSNGWKVGKNAMRDWKAATRNWTKKLTKSSVNQPQQQQYDHEAARQREIEEIRKGLM